MMYMSIRGFTHCISVYDYLEEIHPDVWPDHKWLPKESRRPVVIATLHIETEWAGMEPLFHQNLSFFWDFLGDEDTPIPVESTQITECLMDLLGRAQ